jgi:hypothetical protein
VKDVIRRPGENANAFEVEEESLCHPDVVTVAVFTIPSALGDGAEDEVKAAVVAREDSVAVRGFSEKDLWEWSVKNMARFQVPSVIKFVPSIAKTPTGTVNNANSSKEGWERFEIIKGIMPTWEVFTTSEALIITNICSCLTCLGTLHVTFQRFISSLIGLSVPIDQSVR